MKRLLAALLFVPSLAFAQSVPPPFTTFGAVPTIPQWTTAWQTKQDVVGVFNVRLMYGGVPDGSTDNATAITSAFAATNAFNTDYNGTNGIPTVYFDCNPGTTTCVYKYSGSGVSPINPLYPTSIVCAPGVTLNYTGTAHAVDIGPTGLSGQGQLGRWLVQGCQFTGGANYTAGIYINNWLENIKIEDNTFLNFGNVTYYSIVVAGNNYRMVILNNNWIDTDGTARSMVDAHSAINPDMLFMGNKTSCIGAGASVCAVSGGNIGVGVWTAGGAFITGNEITFHQPAVRLGSSATNAWWITNNTFESNSGTLGPAISYGDPGGSALNMYGASFIGNFFYWPVASNVPIIGPETPVTGSYTLNHSSFINNAMGPAPTGGAVYVNSNSGQFDYFATNRGPNLQSELNQTTSPPIIDTGFSTTKALFGLQAYGWTSAAFSNALAGFDSTGLNMTTATLAQVSPVTYCAGGVPTGVNVNCTPPGYFSSPIKGGFIIVSTTTTNTGSSYTITMNSTGYTVKKNNGAALVAGDFNIGMNFVVYDGTNFELLNPANIAQALTGTTGSIGGGALTNACASGSVSITGVTTAMAIAVSPVADITSGGTVAFSVFGVPTAGSVTVYVCGTGTPTATTYNVRAVL